MNDRELLELAAKASGQQIHWTPDGIAYRLEHGLRFNWNPLTDDGDALRLAVTLSLDININDGECVVFSGDGFVNEKGDDTAALVRRAIVRASAEIWSAMQ